ncbi:alpha/beta hydrolase fold domain-containing protein [Streptomyces sp. HUCO-GS316]|uniref:alpha/beta hydrolase n=1 Tax=Streptomyces sp. HUCO-GS316 TaxID=2692198 RepID=UPI00136FEFD2|nr:alpha/beta hydrolase [Streptomyces sp. HUCO-GS316]MXM68669.1 alpha/beta hydrolase fold domain-containing protein [Streptomyces sp. HUCO-GS316]
MAFALDPQVAEIFAPMAAAMADMTPPQVGDVAGRRAALEGLIAHSDTAQPAPADVTITDHHLLTADGEQILLRWYTKQGTPSEPGPAAVYFHGGGMILGHVGLFDGSIARYVSASGTPILSVDYRLAPEHPHPTPVEDAYAALVWLHEHAVELGVDPARIAVFGDSAGGGIAAAVSILARDRQGPAIAQQILLMPMLDDRNLTADPQLTPFMAWSWDDNRTGWGALLGDAIAGPDVPAHAAPARVADPAGLPPAYIEVGQLDIFRDEDLTYALRLSQAGVPVEFHLHPGVPHEFDGIAFTTDVAQRVMADRIRVLSSL